MRPQMRAIMPRMSEASDAIDTSLATNATKPASASVDGRSASQHNLKDQIAAAKYLAEKDALDQASGNKALGFRLYKFKPPGA